MEFTFGGWISSYVVITNITNKEGATVFASLFWIAKAIFVFVFTFAPGTGSHKLKFLIISMMSSVFLTLFIIHIGETALACYTSCFLFGLGTSSMYALIMVFAIEEGLKIEESQTTNIVIAGAFSEGIITNLVGQLMYWFNPNMLFYSLLVISVLMWIIYNYSLTLI